jgi:hypothetical protein
MCFRLSATYFNFLLQYESEWILANMVYPQQERKSENLPYKRATRMRTEKDKQLTLTDPPAVLPPDKKWLRMLYG